MKVLCTNGPWTLPLCPHIWEPLQLTLSLPFPHHFCAIQKTWRLRQFWRTWKNVDKTFWIRFRTSSVQFSCSVMSDSLQHRRLQQARPPCPSPTLGVYPNSSIELMMPSNHLILCRHLLLLLPIFQPASGFFFPQWVSSSHQVAKVLEFQLQHQSFQWIFRTDLL